MAVERLVGGLLDEALHQRQARPRRRWRRSRASSPCSGWIMPAPLLMPVTVTVRPPSSQTQRRRLGHGVGRHDRLGGLRPAVRPRIGERGRQRRLDALVRQRLHDHAGGKRQHLLGAAAEQSAERSARRARARQPVGAGAGVGIAGVDQDRAHLAARGEVLAAQLHRRGAEPVGGEHAGDRGAGIERHHGQVAPVRPCGCRPWRCRGRGRRRGARRAVELRSIELPIDAIPVVEGTLQKRSRSINGSPRNCLVSANASAGYVDRTAATSTGNY